MSLDAAVFRGRQSLEKEFGLNDIELIDPLTGEHAYIDTSKPSPPSIFIAYETELANIATAGELRSLLRGRIENDSILLTKVLRDGSHCGDVIGSADIERLSQELQQIAGHEDELVRDLRCKLGKLIEASRQQANPIVFV
jgi:hypothetical protein